LLKGAIGGEINITFDNPECRECNGKSLDLQIYVADKCEDIDYALYCPEIGEMIDSPYKHFKQYYYYDVIYPCDVQYGTRLKSIVREGSIAWKNFQGSALLIADNDCPYSCPYKIRVEVLSKPGWCAGCWT
jgi:hypothetical protein